MDKTYAQYLLEKTRDDYNLIAENYARTRAFIPDDIRVLGEYANEHERILDMGCASGRLSEVFYGKNVDFFGIDNSERLIEIAKKKYPKANFRIADALSLPFPDNYFDKVYSVSVVHNIPSREFRLQYMAEARRVLKPGGLFILRVWDFWRRKAAIKLILKYTFLKLIGKSKLDFNDVFVPWRDGGGEMIVNRYFHCFTQKELEGLFKKARFKIKRSWRAGRDPRTNIYVVAQKLDKIGYLIYNNKKRRTEWSELKQLGKTMKRWR